MTLKAKEDAWNMICDEYNGSPIISIKEGEQLKKMWCNMKGTRRDNLTREKQSRLATGGGPEIQAAEVHPEIAEITPNLITTAPTIFSSNMSNEALKEREFAVLDDTCTIDYLIEEGGKDSELATEPPSASTSQLSQRKCLRENIAITSRKKNNTAVIDEVNIEEKTLKLERICCIIKQEEELELLKKKT